jgi:FixJ family two-component response regulator
LRKGLAHRPSVLIADVNMPPGHGDDGLRAAIELRRQRPETGVLVLSQYYEGRYALDLIGERAEGVGYLLKERVGDVDSFIDAVSRVAGGGSALDPEVVGRMLGRRQRDRPLDRLSPRERDVLAAMAEGKSNHGIARELLVSPPEGLSSTRRPASADTRSSRPPSPALLCPVVQVTLDPPPALICSSDDPRARRGQSGMALRIRDRGRHQFRKRREARLDVRRQRRGAIQPVAGLPSS